MAFELASPVFPPGGAIPVDHTCDGLDLSPPLRWSSPPPETKSFALIVDDPDAPGGTWVHWTLYDMAATLRELPGSIPPTDRVDGIGIQGVNSFGKIGYGGPCPPPGPSHRYVFTLYALRAGVGLPARRGKAALLKAMRGRVLAQAELVGRYGRR